MQVGQKVLASAFFPGISLSNQSQNIVILKVISILKFAIQRMNMQTILVAFDLFLIFDGLQNYRPYFHERKSSRNPICDQISFSQRKG